MSRLEQSPLTSPLLGQQSELSFSADPAEAVDLPKPGHRDGTVSFSVVVQGFLITALVLIAVSISLMFRFLSVVAVDKVGAMYFDSAASGVKIRMSGLAGRTGGDLDFLVESTVGYPHDPDSSGSGGDELPLIASSLQEICDDFYSARDLLFRAVDFTDPIYSSDLVDFRWTDVCSCNAIQTMNATTVAPCFNVQALSSKSSHSHHLHSASSAKAQYVTNLEGNGTLTTLTVQVTMLVNDSAWTTFLANDTSAASSTLAYYQYPVSVYLNVDANWLREVLDAFHTSDGSEGITAYFVKSSEPEGTPLVESFVRPRSNSVLSTESASVFSLDIPGLDWSVAVEAGNSVVNDLRQGTYVVVVIALTITLAVAIAAVLLLRVVLTPLAKLRGDMMAAAQLSFDGLPLRRSVIREINEMNASFGLMVARLRSYKPMLLEMAESQRRRTLSRSSVANLYDFDAIDGEEHAMLEGDGDGARHMVKVTCRYLTRRRGLEKRKVTFDHPYTDGDRDLLPHFLENCLLNMELSKFEVVTLYVDHGNHPVMIRTSRQLEQQIAQSPGELNVSFKKSAVKTLLSPFSLFVDLLNLSLNLGLIFTTIFIVDATRAQRLSVYLFSSLYGFAFIVNVPIALWCLKRGQADERFKEWLKLAGLEVSVMLLLCSLNTQHVHFLWSHWSVFGALNFNAPRPLELWKMCVRWSLFGFFFSDLMQLFYKVFRLWNDEPLTVMTGFALATSVVSIALALPKKVTFFALSRKKVDDDDGEIVMRTRTGMNQTLSSQEATLVLFRLPNTEKKTPQRLSVECSAFYSITMAQIRRCEGTVLYFHASDVLAIFNAPKPLDRHWGKAASCAIATMDALKGLRISAFATITTDQMPVGTIGSNTRKSFQCCSPSVHFLSRIMSHAMSYKINIIATRKTASQLESATFKVRTIPTLFDDGLFELKARNSLTTLLQESSPNSIPPAPALARGLSLFGILDSDSGEDNALMKHIGTLVTRWLNCDDKSKGFLNEDGVDDLAETHGDLPDVHKTKSFDLDPPSDEEGGPGSEEMVLRPPVAAVAVTGPTPVVPRQRTAGFILGHVLRPREPLPDDIEL